MIALRQKIDSCTAAVLCGGASERMGTDKALLKVEGSFLLAQAVSILEGLFTETILVSNEMEKLQKIPDLADTKVLVDKYPHTGPLGAICTALEGINTPYLFVTACDMPNMRVSLIEAMYGELAEAQVGVFAPGGKMEPLFAFYHVSCLPLFTAQLERGDFKIRREFSKLSIKQFVGSNTHLFPNLNTPLEKQHWLEMKKAISEKVQQPFHVTNKIEQMILIGSSGRNSGKTTFGCRLIEKLRTELPVYALKIISIENKGGQCPRGGKGCGTCADIQGEYEWIEETGENTAKDTARLLKAGANRAFLLKTLKNNILEGVEAFFRNVPDDVVVVCESNSVRVAVQPGCFWFVKGEEINMWKKSAKKVAAMADAIITNALQDELPPFSVQKTESGAVRVLPFQVL